MPDSPSLNPLLPPLPSSDAERLRWDGLHGAARALAIASAVRRHHGPVVVIAANATSAQTLTEEVRFFLGDDATYPSIQFPDWETLAYDTFSPHQEIISERLATLATLASFSRGLLISPVATLMSRLPPPAFIEAHSLSLGVGDILDLDDFRRRLERAGYRFVSQVMEHGEFAVRGALIDVYPMGSREPLRIDLFDDEIDTIRRFDPESQRTIDKIERIDLLPAREFPLDASGIKQFRSQWRVRFEGEPGRAPIYREVSDGHAPAGIEYYLPLFFEHTTHFFDYVPSNALVIYSPDTNVEAERFWDEVSERHEARRHDIEKPILDPEEIVLRPDQLFQAVGSLRRVLMSHRAEDEGPEFATRAPPALPVNARSDDPLALARQFVTDYSGRVLFLAETPGRQESMFELLRRHRIDVTRVDDWDHFVEGDTALGLTIAPLSEGTVLDDPSMALVAESQLFGNRANQRRRRRRVGRDAESVVRDLTELKEGAPVVHELHGVGRYRGLQTLDVGGASTEFVTLEYADGDKLYVPVLSLHLISRYSGADVDSAPLHKLGSQQWQKARAKAAEKVRDVAAELLAIHARRAARQGYAYPLPEDAYRQFVSGFPFEETPDQRATIEAVEHDMESEQPMDRLVCGDVGFGKTEVAMRAAFLAAVDGRQVAILVPTTLLAQQHHQTFSDRFADWPVRIEQLSRFRSKKERDAVVAGLGDGRVDIVIGTHRLLQDDVTFKRLGLAIIDEEHRFGVRHKEKLKALRAEVDILTLTATPIPRTLNMALADLRDLSLIATPPETRLSVKTFIREWDGPLLREACLRELHRGGQVYFVHNRVEDIEMIADRVEKLVPEANVRVGHGQMRERDLEQVMLDFYHRRFNVLVCTTIIETGIDVPTANTIIINRADRFGLAQLHQLRGRVGRSHHRAYAYLVIPNRKALTGDAEKRLDALESLDELGIGFSLATHDLEIRGAGELLGEGQSGQMHEVGYALYTELLERAVRALRAGKDPDLDRPLDHGTEIDLHAPALIPEDYLPDVHSRLLLYKRVASARDNVELDDLKVEMIDRFGRLPEPTRTLFEVTELKLRATPMDIRKIDLGASGGRLVFSESPNIDPTNIIKLIQTQPQFYRLDGSDKLRVTASLESLPERLSFLGELLDSLQKQDVAA
ncbi:MAG: transcription-repair coupling factor [Pseudomonadota bacterium]